MANENIQLHDQKEETCVTKIGVMWGLEQNGLIFIPILLLFLKKVPLIQ